MALTAEQKRFWDENGYLAYDTEPLLTPEQVEAIGRTMHEIAVGNKPVDDYVYSVERAVVSGEVKPQSDYDKYRILRWVHKFDEGVLEACRSPKILDVVEDLLGPDIKLYTDQLFMKPPFHGGAIHWHQDSVAWPYFTPQGHLSVWIAIDEATEENGCLHYVAGSHTFGQVKSDRMERFVEMFKEREVAVPRKPGYGVIHHGMTLHASGANLSPHRRRSIGIHYVRSDTYYLCVEPGEGHPPFLLMRGREFPGRV